MTNAYLEPLGADATADVDIVFVHGLNPEGREDYHKQAWTQKGFFWPDDIRTQIPSIRVMMFRWNSAILGDSSNASLNEHANDLLDEIHRNRDPSKRHRPLIFVCHSLGGLLVKQALIISQLNPKYECIYQSTFGLVFFATPHRGGNYANLADFAANIYSSTMGNPKNSLLEQLKKKSVLNDVSLDHFRYQSSRYEIVSYFETKMTRVKIKDRKLLPRISIYVVDKDSAKMDLPRETPLSLDRNHSEICKFSSSQDTAYQRVRSTLTEMVKGARINPVQCAHMDNGRSEIERQQPFAFADDNSGSVPANVYVPQRRKTINVPEQNCPRFVGRTDLEKQMKSGLFQEDAPPGQRTCLTGFGGIGKTELVNHMVKRSRKYRFVLWLSATDKDIFDEHLTHCAYSLKEEIQRSDSKVVGLGSHSNTLRYLPMTLDVPLHIAFTDWVRSEHDESSRVLVVLDDLDGLHRGNHKELSGVFATDTIDLIYTSRNPFLAHNGGSWPAKILKVPALPQDDAVKLSYSMLSDQTQAANHEITPDRRADDDRNVAQEVVRRLDYIPAAIIVALHFAQQRFGTTKVLETLLDEWPQDRILKFPRAAIQYPHSVYGSLELSYFRLQRDTELSTIGDFDMVCMALLWLLSKTNTTKFLRKDVNHLCQRLWSNTQDITIMSPDGLRTPALPDKNKDVDILQAVSKNSPPIIVHFKALKEDHGLAYDCMAQLQQAGFLTEDQEGNLLLNALTRSWTLEKFSSVLFGAEDPTEFIRLMNGSLNGGVGIPQSPPNTNGKVIEPLNGAA